jgi:hypothetical protein
MAFYGFYLLANEQFAMEHQLFCIDFHRGTSGTMPFESASEMLLATVAQTGDVKTDENRNH